MASSARNRRRCSGRRRLLEPAKAASLFETHLAKPWRTCQQQAIYAASRINQLRKSSSAASHPPPRAVDSGALMADVSPKPCRGEGGPPHAAHTNQSRKSSVAGPRRRRIEANTPSRRRRSEPSGHRVGEPQLGEVSHPGHIGWSCFRLEGISIICGDVPVCATLA
jgi:hypothetical protein